MKSDFYIQIANSDAHRVSRDMNCDAALKTEGNLVELFVICFDLDDKIHFKGCWTLELVVEQNLQLLFPYLDTFCNTISKYKNDSAIRPMSKICMLLSKNKSSMLTTLQEEKIIETCLDWLIQDEKVAAKAYAMRALCNFGKKYSWINAELKTILSQDYANHSPAYKAAAKDVLKRLK
ncbi:MAG: hypothetical protein V4648_01545 [Bacteroidota bacterium]